MKKYAVITVFLVFALSLPVFGDSFSDLLAQNTDLQKDNQIKAGSIKIPKDSLKAIDIFSVVGNQPVKNIVAKYKIPPEGSLEWLEEEVKAKKERVEWNNIFDDFAINRPGDSWKDLKNELEFEVATIVSIISFACFYKADGLVLEDRFKAFGLTSIIVIVQEVVGSIFPNTHLCAKELTAGIAGAFFGSFVITLPIRF